jgi:hypothetical protein
MYNITPYFNQKTARVKKFLFYAVLLICTVIVSAKPIKAQDAASDPGAYMNAIDNAENAMNQSYMAYVSAAAHSSRKRKIEKMRVQAVVSITDCRYKIIELPIYKGDNSLRQSSINYVQVCYKVFNDDYAHLINMEDISEQSFDGMQAYLLVQEAIDDTLKAASDRMEKAETDFAAKYNVKLVSQKTELGDKMEATGKLNKYRNNIYLIFFKCNWEDNQLAEAINKKNITKIEQTRSALDKYAIEGLAALDTLKAFENDPSLAVTCKQALTFFKKEAETQIPVFTDFFLKEEEFNKLKNATEAKADRTKQDVDAYNKAVNDFNNAVKKYNEVNNELNSSRPQIIKNWNDTEKSFLDAHTPYFK